MDELIAESDGGILRLTIHRPERRNAMSPAVVEGITAALLGPGRDPATRAIVVTGSGDKAFCAGADLQTGKSFSFDHSIPNQAFANLLRAAHAATVPLVARVNGACMAGGMGLLASLLRRER